MSDLPLSFFPVFILNSCMQEEWIKCHSATCCWRICGQRSRNISEKCSTAKIVNQRPVKNCKHFSIEENSIAIGWRQKNAFNSEIGRCLGCGVDAIGSIYRVAFLLRSFFFLRILYFLSVHVESCFFFIFHFSHVFLPQCIRNLQPAIHKYSTVISLFFCM